MSSTLVLQGLTFISGPIFSSRLGTDNYGIAAVYLTWVTLASTVFSLQAAGTLAVAQVNYPEDQQNAYQSSVLSLATISYFSFSLITIIITTVGKIWFAFNLPMIALGLIQGWGMYCVSTMNLKLTYEFKADKNFVLSILTSGLTIGLSIILINYFPENNNYWGRILGQAIIYALIGFIVLFLLLRSGKTIYNKDYWRFTLPIAIPTIFHTLASIVLNQSDKIMLQGLINNSAAGIYALAATFGSVMHSLWNAFNNSWVPFYYDYTKHNQTEEMRKHAKNYIELFTVMCMGFILLAKEVFHIYANIDFWSGTDLIPLFAIGHYFIFLYSFPVNYEFYNKKTKVIAIGTTIAAIMNIILNYLLICLCGIIGAVVATVLAHALQFIFHYIIANKMPDSEFPFKMKDFVPGCLFVFGTGIFYIFTKDIWLLRWGLGVCLGIYIIVKIVRRREIF